MFVGVFLVDQYEKFNVWDLTVIRNDMETSFSVMWNDIVIIDS